MSDIVERPPADRDIHIYIKCNVCNKSLGDMVINPHVLGQGCLVQSTMTVKPCSCQIERLRRQLDNYRAVARAARNDLNSIVEDSDE